MESPSPFTAEIGIISGKGKKLPELVDNGKDIFLPDKVDLIDKQYNRQSDIAEGFNNKLIVAVNTFRGLDNKKDDISAFEGIRGCGYHEFIQRCRRPVDARRVDEYHLPVFNVLDACDPVSCSLRLTACYGNLFAYDLIQDRRLSHVWSAELCL